MSALPRRPGPTRRVRVREYAASAEGERVREDRVATEEPLEIRLEWPGAAAHTAWTTLRTPGHDFELAAGWAHHEGLGRPSGVAYCTDVSLPREQEFNTVTVQLASAPSRVPSQLPALSAGSAACGVCGTDRIEEVLARVSHEARPEVPPVDVVRQMPTRLAEKQEVFRRTGGVHGAGLFDAAGHLLLCREDVGRHNALDKATGARMLAGDTAAVSVVVVSGRAGFELVQKAAVAGVGCLVAVGAPSGLAIDLASRAGLGLFGWTSEDRTVRYA